MRFGTASLALLLASACSVGQGEGEMTGSVRDPACEVDVPDYSLRPTFFAADVIEERDSFEPQRRLSVRVQRGSFRETDSDGFLILIDDVNTIARERLGEPISLSPDDDDLVQMTLYLNETCDSGFPQEFWRIPLVLSARSGTITFDAVYAPDLDTSQTHIAGHFTDVLFQSQERPERTATMSGTFSFFYQRGRPAQPFP